MSETYTFMNRPVELSALPLDHSMTLGVPLVDDAIQISRRPRKPSSEIVLYTDEFSATSIRRIDGAPLQAILTYSGSPDDATGPHSAELEAPGPIFDEPVQTLRIGPVISRSSLQVSWIASADKLSIVRPRAFELLAQTIGFHAIQKLKKPSRG
jgi:hypothetical protein